MQPTVTLLYVPGEQIGYGRLGVYLAKHLQEDHGVTLYNDDGNPLRTEGGHERKLNHAVTAPSPTNLLCYVSVPSHMKGRWSGQHVAFFTMWEATRIPESFRDTFHEIDTMIVPSLQNLELFSRYHDNVHFVPLGVDPELWHYIPPPPVTNEFRFMIAGRGTRKGVDLAYRAFTTVFKGVRSGPRPRLIMKSLKAHDVVSGYFHEDVEHQTGWRDPIAERDLYANAHCYIQPSRGEGFGLQPLQAIALGRPTILTAAHGHDSFAHLGMGLSARLGPADYFIYGFADEWWEPDFDELCEQMWDVYKRYDIHAERAREGAAEVAADFTWDAVTTRFMSILGPEMTKPGPVNPTWVPSTKKQFRIRLLRDYSCDIAGRHLEFTEGVDYWDVADVKRIFYDAGILDPDCCNDDDHGLTELQVAQLGKYRADHTACPRCGRDCGCERAADRIYREMVAADEAADATLSE